MELHQGVLSYWFPINVNGLLGNRRSGANVTSSWKNISNKQWSISRRYEHLRWSLHSLSLHLHCHFYLCWWCYRCK
jgi:hypothetical protein